MRSRLPLVASAALAACGPSPVLLPRPQRAAESRAARLRVMTYNIESGARGLEGVGQALREVGADLVALHEVDRGTTRAGGLDQSEALAGLAGLPYHAHFRATGLYGGDYGLALLSRYPLRSVEQRPLPTWPGLEPRILVHAVVEVEGRLLSIYLTHLSHLPTRAPLRLQQARAIRAVLDADPGPLLLLGDLNEGPDSGAVGELQRGLINVFDRVGQGPSGTYPLPVPLGPTLRLDYVLSGGGVLPRRSFVYRSPASDHYPVVADLELP